MLLIFTTYKISFIYQTFRLVGMKAFYFPTDIFISSEKKHMKTVEILYKFDCLQYELGFKHKCPEASGVTTGGHVLPRQKPVPNPAPPIWQSAMCCWNECMSSQSPPKKSLHHWLSCSFTPSYTAAQNITFSNLILDFWVFYDFNCINYDWRIYWGSFWAPGLGGSTWRVWTSWPSCQRICVGLRSHNYHPRYSHVLASE